MRRRHTVLCDSGTRYASRLFNPAFLRARQLPVPAWLEAAAPPLPPGVVLPAGADAATPPSPA